MLQRLFSCFYICVFVFFGYIFPSVLASNDLPELTTETFDNLIPRNIWLIVFYSPNCPHCHSLLPTIKQLNQIENIKTSTKYKIGLVNCLNEKTICERMNIQGYPTIKVLLHGKAYLYENERTLKSIQDFLFLDYTNTKVTSSLQSHPILSLEEHENYKREEKQKHNEMLAKSNVQIITEKNFTTLIWKKSKDRSENQTKQLPWLLKCYAPWCGHCKRIYYMWHELSQHSYTKNFQIGDVDCTVNRILCEQLSIQGFPTLLWIVPSENDNNIIYEYKGERSIPKLLQYMENPNSWHKYGTVKEYTEQLSIFNMWYQRSLQWMSEYPLTSNILIIVTLLVLMTSIVFLFDYCLQDDALLDEKLNEKNKIDELIRENKKRFEEEEKVNNPNNLAQEIINEKEEDEDVEDKKTK